MTDSRMRESKAAHVLTRLHQIGGFVTHTEVIFQINDPDLSRILRALEVQGLVERHYRVTAKGREWLYPKEAAE